MSHGIGRNHLRGEIIQTHRHQSERVPPGKKYVCKLPYRLPWPSLTLLMCCRFLRGSVECGCAAKHSREVWLRSGLWTPPRGPDAETGRGDSGRTPPRTCSLPKLEKEMLARAHHCYGTDHLVWLHSGSSRQKTHQ